MQKPKRLFLVAGYDKAGIIDDAYIHQISALSKFGDVISVMDSDCSDAELSKIKPFVLFASGARHGEYDFGSYKRAYLYAAEKDILKKYDFLYLINNSVYGPLFDLAPYLQDMESKNTDAFGLVYNPHKKHPHIQSWFIGLRRTIFLSDWFDDFMRSITKQASKTAITAVYEQGFTEKLLENKSSIYCIYNVSGRGIYNEIKKLYRKKLPFMKKDAFPRRQGILGAQLLYVLNKLPTNLKNIILDNAKRTYGDEYINWLLTKNPIKIIYRNIHYALIKIFKEGI